MMIKSHLARLRGLAAAATAVAPTHKGFAPAMISRRPCAAVGCASRAPIGLTGTPTGAGQPARWLAGWRANQSSGEEAAPLAPCAKAAAAGPLGRNPSDKQEPQN
jgi:hypothetical protein